ncbi:MAG: pyridoxamine kinase [Clostridia bacterium]
MKILAIHDLAGFGRSSLTTIISVFAKFGHQCVPAPTAIFSTHTAFADYKMCDLSGFLDEYIEHYNKLNLKFDAIYSGFLSSESQIDSVISACGKFPQSSVIIDPVMGDEGKVYTTYTKSMCEKMKKLIRHADIITPNITEVKILLDLPMDFLATSEHEILNLSKKLANFGPKTIIITGLHLNNDKIATAFYSNGNIYFHENDYIDQYFPGTGDLFTSIFISKMLNGDDLQKSVEFASDFIGKAINHTIKLGTEPLFGVEFESLL